MDNCNYATDGLEWESVLTSLFLDQEGGGFAWTGTCGEPAADAVAAAPHHERNSPPVHLSNIPPHSKALTKSGDSKPSTSVTALSSNVAIVSERSFESSDPNQDTSSSSQYLPAKALANDSVSAVGTKKKKKKRDPRLECPNFLAGRIPCSCPEDDELDEECEARDGVKKRTKAGGRCQVPSCGGDISHLKGYHQRRRVCLGCANSPEVLLRGQQQRYCQQCGKFHRLCDFDEDKRSCRRKLERHNRRRRRQSLDEDEEAQDLGASVLEVGEESEAVGVSAEAGLDLSNLVINDVPGVDDLSTSAVRCGQGPIACRSNDEQPCLATVMRGANQGVEITRQDLSDTCTPKQELPNAAHPSIVARRCDDYKSLCPTGRLSFKLYDWNPADFPRRLRQQICEWLANMPLELEGYIRSGCIIMTFFVTAPQTVWDMIAEQWVGQIQKLLHWSGPKLWGTSRLLTPTHEECISMKDGICTQVDVSEKLLTPYIVDLYPLSLQAGCQCHIYVSGFNFYGARFFVSFGELYLECSNCKPLKVHHARSRSVWKIQDSLEFWKVTVFLPQSPQVGPAYLEVDNGHGVSNFMPLLVADKDVCAEINTFSSGCLPLSAACGHVGSRHEVLKDSKKSPDVLEFLADLGWALKDMNNPTAMARIELHNAFRECLQRQLSFCSKHGWYSTAQRLIKSVFRKSPLVGRHHRNMTVVVLRVAEDIPGILSPLSRCKYHESNSLFRTAALSAIDISNQATAICRSTHLHTKLRLLSSVVLLCSNVVWATWIEEWTVIDPSTHKTRQNLEDSWMPKERTFSWRMGGGRGVSTPSECEQRPALWSGNNGVGRLMRTVHGCVDPEEMNVDT